MKRPFPLPTTSTALVALLCANAGGLTAQQLTGANRAAALATIDSLVDTPIKAGTLAGASIAVVRGKDTLVLKGYGMADLELEVPTPRNATYEIGSVTKQFTAVAVMQLVEQGKVRLDDDITKYLPDYNTQGHSIPVRRLLDHTSGIKGYTEIPEFRSFAMRTAPRDSLVAIFAAKPFDFAPGEQETYNNSAFFLAGLLIEKVSGMSYADYVQKNLFDKAGMTSSYYCNESTIRKHHAHGYDTGPKGLVLKGFINHTWPYAAGSLCSTAGDMVAWNQALHRSDRVINRETYRELIAPSTLNDGTRIRYAKGLALVDVGGRRAISHGGDIPGFASFGAYLPDEDLTVIALFNSQGPARPDAIAGRIVQAVLGKAPDQSQTFSGDLAQFEGTYTGRGRGRDMTVTVTVDNGVLRLKRNPADSGQALVFRGADTFAAGGALVTFDKAGGKVTRLRLDAGYAHNILARK